jgi:hypothetical protein
MTDLREREQQLQDEAAAVLADLDLLACSDSWGVRCRSAASRSG